MMTKDAATTPVLTPKYIAEQLGGAKREGDGWVALCPCHEDTEPSLRVATGTTQPIIIKCRAKCKGVDVIDVLKERGLWPKRRTNTGECRNAPIGEYEYFTEDGMYAYTKKKFAAKKAGERKPLSIGRYVKNDKGFDIWQQGKPKIPVDLLYNLPELVSGKRSEKELVVLVEGEKDVDNLGEQGFIATSLPNGSGSTWKPEFTRWLAPFTVAVIPDNDSAGREYATKVIDELGSAGIQYRVIQLNDLEEKGDVSDWFEMGHTGDELQDIVQEAFAEKQDEFEIPWVDRLKTTEGGIIKKLLINAAIPFRYAPEIRGHIKYNLFTNEIEVDSKMPWGDIEDGCWRDHHTLQATYWLNDEDIPADDGLTLKGVVLAARDHAYDPLKDYLNGLEWDGKPRIDTWLKDYCAATSPDDYLDLISAKVLIAAVARGLAPGSKVDNTLILESSQGLKNTSFVKALVPNDDWADRLPEDLRNKDTLQGLQGIWVMEVPEFVAGKKAEQNTLKVFFDSQHDRFRVPYGKIIEKFKRRCFFIGSHNPDSNGYLRDATGNRRFWPVATEKIDLGKIRADRDQLWAEAVQRFKQGEPWWIEDEGDNPILLREQGARRQEAPLAEDLKQYITHEFVTSDSTDRMNIKGDWYARDEPLDKVFLQSFFPEVYGTAYTKSTSLEQHIARTTMDAMRWEHKKIRNPKQDNRPMWGYRKTHKSLLNDPGNVPGKGVPGRNISEDEASSGGGTTTTSAPNPENGGECNPPRNANVTPSGTEKQALQSDSYANVPDVPSKSKDLLEVGREGDVNSVLPVYKSFEEVPGTLENLAKFLENHNPHPIGFDIETTALSPLDGRSRLMQFWREGEHCVLDLDAIDIDELRPLLATAHLVAFNVQFEYQWFLKMGLEPAQFDCGKLAYSALFGGPTSLKDAAKKLLGVTMDKTQQTSDWSGELTQEQIDYAILDAELALKLWDYLTPLMEKHDTGYGYDVLINAVPGIAAMQANGMQFDLDSHSTYIATIKEAEQTALATLKDTGAVDNWNSPKQIVAWIKSSLERKTVSKWPRTKTNQLSAGAPAINEAFELGIVPKPCADILKTYLEYKEASTILKTFGDSLAEKVRDDGRIYGSLQIAGAVTGRMSSSKPNLQNFPSSKQFRGLFVAAPGNRIVVCDYSQIEVRVGGLLADEPVLADIFARGDDVHTASAALMYHKDIADVTKDERKTAKAVTFGMQYGMGAKSLAKRLEVPLAEAERQISKWEAMYPKVAKWRTQQAKTGQENKELFLESGRRIELGYNPAPSVCYNYPVQGAAADVMYAAIAKLHTELQQEGFEEVKPLAVVHDEIVLEVPVEQAQEVAEVLELCMQEGYREIFPGADLTGLVDASIGNSWAAK